MTQGNQSSLRFSLEESVWFQRGQEVEELVSISLDPNITIQENDQYVMIRGSLDLTGEYKRQADSTTEESQWGSLQKWVQTVEEREEGLCEFSHQFPVDITIPTTRVRDLSEIDVLIETFDYVLPEKSCLKLTAELNISGLYGEQEKEEVREDDEELVELNIRNLTEENEEELEESEVEMESEYEPFEVVAKKEETFFTEPTFVESSSYQPQKPEISFAAYRNEQVPVVQEQELPSQDEVGSVEVDLTVVVESSESSSSSVAEVPVKKKASNKKSMSIAEFLARKEGEDDSAKLKVCIVQHGDTVDALAERYQVNVQQLLKVNKLELNQDVHEGQVLYIPQVYVRK
ncbi:MAG TPA: stage VI sporulation protein D [Pseudoneobacillus sp.]|nr:stage VI sporulation protein D [Pseudoneobacillus sp.]